MYNFLLELFIDALFLQDDGQDVVQTFVNGPTVAGSLQLMSRSERRLKWLGETMLLEEDGVEEGRVGEGVEG